jgi:hypothetical protein
MKGHRKRGSHSKHNRNFDCSPPPLRLLTFLFDLIKNLFFVSRQTETPDNKKLTEQEKESIVLKMANAKKGKITIAEVAMDSQLNLDESKTILEKMSADGVAELQITDGGSLVYVFTGLLSEKEKQTSKEPLNI